MSSDYTEQLPQVYYNTFVYYTTRSHGIEEQVQLVRSRHLQMIDGETQDPKPFFNLPRLQKDIIKAYLAGKPLIEHSPEHVRVPFKFRAEASKTVSLGGADLDLSVISEYIRLDSGFRVRNTVMLLYDCVVEY